MHYVVCYKLIDEAAGTRCALPQDHDGPCRGVEAAHDPEPDNVVPFGGVTRLDTDPRQMLQRALDHGMAGVVIIGFDQNGDEYFASSFADGGDVVWHLERAKFKLMVIADALASDPQRG